MSRPSLAHERVTSEAGNPRAWVYLLHGIYGAGRNWGSVARRLVRERPDWGALLIDLRQHGASRGFSAPHTVRAAAEDLAILAKDIELPPRALLGHSFGGKVALAFARRAPRTLEQVWVVDSSPDAREPGGSAWQMLDVLRAVPEVFEDRAAAIRTLEERGLDRPVAQWMATNLEHRPDGLRWRFDLDEMEALLRDFFDTDLWDVVESPPAGVDVILIRAEQSSVLAGDSLERARRAARDERVHLHIVAGGHWLNADNPDAIVKLLVERLPRG